MKYFPAFLSLRDRDMLIVGNGLETEPKLLQFLETGARIKVVSPEPLPVVSELAAAGKIQYRQGNFQECDLQGMWLVVGTGNDREENERIVRAAECRRIFYNIVDVTLLCSFITPAIVSRGDVNIAISTSGTSPALAQRLKKEISELVGPEYGQIAEILGELRPRILEEIPDREKRFALFHHIVNSEVLSLLRVGLKTEALQLIETYIGDVVHSRELVDA